MRVCLTCIELFGDSVYGGFGRSTRFIGRELARRGVDVTIVVPRRSPEHPAAYDLDGVHVRQYRPDRPWQAASLFRAARADVYHSQDTSLGTAIARAAAPSAAHVVTFRDPIDRKEWTIESHGPGTAEAGWPLYRLFVKNPLVTLAVRTADARYCAAEFLAPKAMRIYGLRRPPAFLPSPVHMPLEIRKADRPAVCFVGRWEGRKRVELFFELARRCPDVDFVAVGAARDGAHDRALRDRYGDIQNLRLTGVLDQFATPEWSAVLERSWILVNTSAREGLPTTFVEAAAHGCAILSFVDPDGFATRFGRKAEEGKLDEGLRALLAGGAWRARGEAGREHVSRVFAVDAAIDAHLRAYESALAGKSRRRA